MGNQCHLCFAKNVKIGHGNTAAFFRRIVKDYEYTVQSSIAWLILANMKIMLNRLFDKGQI